MLKNMIWLDVKFLPAVFKHYRPANEPKLVAFLRVNSFIIDGGIK